MTAAETEASMTSGKERLRALAKAIGEARAAGVDAAKLIAEHKQLHDTLKEQGGWQKRSEPPLTELKVITDLGDFSASANAYFDLWSRSTAQSPFLCPDWLLPWLQSFGKAYDLHLVVVHQGPKWLAAAPLMIGEERGVLGMERVVRFVGTGPGLRGNYFTFLLDPSAIGLASPLLSDYLNSLIKGGRALRLEHISPFADGELCLRLLLQQPVRDLHLATEHLCIHGALPQSYGEFVRSVHSSSRRRFLRVYEDWIEPSGERVDYLECTDEAQVPEFLGALGCLNIQRRRQKRQSSTWGDPVNQTCRVAAAVEFLRHGMLRLEILRHRSEPVAALIGLVCKGTYFCYNMGFSQDFAHHHPGHMLLARRIRLSIEEGLKEFDFLVGDADYKRQYFRTALPELSLSVFPPGSRSNLADATRILFRNLKAHRSRH